MDILSARHIVKRYSNHTALDDVTISVPGQCIFGLLGPNGAGKTSLIRIINQITGPDSGEILFEGVKLSQEHISKIGYLPEERGLYKKMEVGEQVLYLARLKGMKRPEAVKKINEWFERFEMGGWWKKKIEELSKGMQQKVQFIVTVIHEPKLIILDEPFSGFDPINANLIKNEIFALREKGATVLFSTHNMSSVEELCDHIALINKAKKILDGPVKEIKKANRSNTYEMEFTGSTIGFTNALWTSAELLDKQEEDGHTKVKVKLLGKNTVNDLLGAVLPHVQVQSLKEIVPSMNDIFISKVQEKEMNVSANITE